MSAARLGRVTWGKWTNALHFSQRLSFFGCEVESAEGTLCGEAGRGAETSGWLSFPPMPISLSFLLDQGPELTLPTFSHSILAH
jgi:hypothetical protein